MSDWRIITGDALEELAKLPPASVSAFVTDPPYTLAGSSSNGRHSQAESQFFLFWLKAVCSELRRVVEPSGCGFVFCDWRTVNLVVEAIGSGGDVVKTGWVGSQALAWDRESIGMGSPFRNSFEMIVFARGPAWRSALPKDLPTVVRHRWPYGRHKYHGAEKPVGLCKQLVEWALPSGDGVELDPFAGSGTVGIAAKEAGVEFLGIELSPEYVAMAERRIGEATRQGRLPLAEPQPRAAAPTQATQEPPEPHDGP